MKKAIKAAARGRTHLLHLDEIVEYFNQHPDAYIRINHRDRRGDASGYITYPGAREDGVNVDPDSIYSLMQLYRGLLRSERGEGEYIRYYYLTDAQEHL